MCRPGMRAFSATHRGNLRGKQKGEGPSEAARATVGATEAAMRMTVRASKATRATMHSTMRAETARAEEATAHGAMIPAEQSPSTAAIPAAAEEGGEKENDDDEREHGQYLLYIFRYCTKKTRTGPVGLCKSCILILTGCSRIVVTVSEPLFRGLLLPWHGYIVSPFRCGCNARSVALRHGK